MKNVDRLFITAPTTYTAQRDCVVLVHAFGGSGSGGLGRNRTGTATGGGAGARCSKKVSLKAGDTLTLTPGAGGAANPATASGTANGNDGGDTTVTGPNGLSMVAGGGKGGLAAQDNSLTATLGGAGGVATGGDENITGGRGGNAAASSLASHTRATGGGALPLFDMGHRGGDITATEAQYCATGGGGVGGRGGDITGTNIASTATGGGSAFNSGGDTTTTSTTSTGGADKSAGTLDIPLFAWLPTTGPGSNGQSGTTADAGPGAGSGGGIGASATSGAAGAYGGSGGAVATSGGGGAGGGNEYVRGGSGGMMAIGSNTATVAKGGDGFIILEILP